MMIDEKDNNGEPKAAVKKRPGSRYTPYTVSKDMKGFATTGDGLRYPPPEDGVRRLAYGVGNERKRYSVG